MSRPIDAARDLACLSTAAVSRVAARRRYLGTRKSSLATASPIISPRIMTTTMSSMSVNPSTRDWRCSLRTSPQRTYDDFDIYFDRRLLHDVRVVAVAAFLGVRAVADQLEALRRGVPAIDELVAPSVRRQLFQIAIRRILLGIHILRRIHELLLHAFLASLVQSA